MRPLARRTVRESAHLLLDLPSASSASRSWSRLSRQERRSPSRSSACRSWPARCCSRGTPPASCGRALAPSWWSRLLPRLRVPTPPRSRPACSVRCATGGRLASEQLLLAHAAGRDADLQRRRRMVGELSVPAYAPGVGLRPPARRAADRRHILWIRGRRRTPLPRQDYRRQLRRFVAGVRRPLRHGGTTNLGPSYRFH